ncbi:MAG TPA: ABC transporter ATP-binding protein [Gaiellaceae bacterium]|jgi:iron(III) transport system ATP-binding protein
MSVRIHGLTKRFGGKSSVVAIDHLDLEVEPGEFLVLLGPSGCGKTTTLRCIAGLETAEEGQIAFGERILFDAGRRINVPPNKRNLGMVFQSYALWPHMNVRKNIGYPLRTRRVKGGEADRLIEEVATLVDTGNLLDRYPSQLSGGQQQRVALSRGLVARPDLVLFDEPLSNLDARLRDLVRSEIHELHARLGFTAVYVTHDQVEALALGDRLAIMRAGKLEQLATPEQVFEEPATDYVAGFIGMGNRVMVERHDHGWSHEGELVTGLGFDAPSATLSLRSRAEDVQLAPADEPAPPETIAFKATVVDSEFGGRHMDVALTIGSTRVMSRIPAGPRGSWARTLNAGQSVLATMHRHNVKAFDETGKLVGAIEHALAG